MKKTIYEIPFIELITFIQENIITTSAGDNDVDWPLNGGLNLGGSTGDQGTMP